MIIGRAGLIRWGTGRMVSIGAATADVLVVFNLIIDLHV